MTNREKVQAGIDLLNAKGPADWRSKVDAAKLVNIQDSLTCVLGQIYGSWFDGCKALGIMMQSSPYGFAAGPHDSEEIVALWKEYFANGTL